MAGRLVRAFAYRARSRGKSAKTASFIPRARRSSFRSVLPRLRLLRLSRVRRKLVFERIKVRLRQMPLCLVSIFALRLQPMPTGSLRTILVVLAWVPFSLSRLLDRNPRFLASARPSRHLLRLGRLPRSPLVRLDRRLTLVVLPLSPLLPLTFPPVSVPLLAARNLLSPSKILS